MLTKEELIEVLEFEIKSMGSVAGNDTRSIYGADAIKRVIKFLQKSDTEAAEILKYLREFGDQILQTQKNGGEWDDKRNQARAD